MDQTAIISSAEEQLKSFGAFLQNYERKLDILLNKVQDVNKPISLKSQFVNIDCDASNREQISLQQLLDTERVFNKTLLTFAYLCTEVDLLCVEAQRMQLKLIFLDEELCALSSEEEEQNAESNKQRVLLRMSKHMEFLCNVKFFLQRCILVGYNLLHNCGAYLAQDDEMPAGMELKFSCIFDSLCQLLLQILIFDELLSSCNFARHWPAYKKTMHAIAQNVHLLQGYSNAEINGLQSSLLELDFLFAGTIFRHFLDSTFALKDKVGAKGIGKLQQQFNEHLKQQLNTLAKCNGVFVDFEQPLLLVRLNAFCVVFHDFCGQVDVKQVKLLLELNAKHQGIMLVANIAWLPNEFLQRHAATLVKPLEKQLLECKKQRQIFLHMRLQSLQRDCRQYCTHITLWILNLRRMLNIDSFDLKVEQFKELAELLLAGLRYAAQLSFLIKALVHAHIIQQSTMSRATLFAICKLLEMLKMLQSTLEQQIPQICRIINCILQYLQYKVLHLLAGCKKKLTSGSKQQLNKQVDTLAALRIAEKCMYGPPTYARVLITQLAVSGGVMTHNNRTLTQEQSDKFKTLMQRIELLSNFQKHLKSVCDTSFIYWHQSILSAYLKQIVERKIDFHSFQLLLNCSDDCGLLLQRLDLAHLKLTDILQKSNFERLRTEIISNLCAQIETFLRLEVHANLHLNQMNPFETSINDYRELINVCPIVLNGHYVVLKDHIENYLSAMFYNLTTISLHDWKTYEQMRHLAKTSMNLNAIEDYLPNQTLEQGIDILEIMRKIHIFVSKYAYNMNTQIFVEQSSANKHLDSIGIRHVANSLRTHGTGVVNTTVNFTYQFLRQKFYTFSQFLYDEQIKSRLMKELRSLAEKKQKNEFPLYAYERADAFNKDIRKLGLSTDGQTYMDLFRKVITHVGNAMGYIRLVRSGSIHANYDGSLFLPKFDENLKFAEMCKQLQMHEQTIKAAENFEANVNHLVKNFSDSTDYFKLLVEAFQPFFRNAHNLHLKNFFLIVPPLMLNYVEYMLSAREKINRKDRQDTVLFDDGFAVGLAYILKLLNQIGDFNSLQWFVTVRERFNAESQKIKEMLADIHKSTTNSKTTTNETQLRENEKLQQTLSLTERRINAHQMEHTLLYYNLCSAKIFFQ